MIKNRGEVLKYGETISTTTVNGLEVTKMVMESSISKMEVITKAPSEVTKSMVLGFTNGRIQGPTKDNGSITQCAAKAF